MESGVRILALLTGMSDHVDRKIATDLSEYCTASMFSLLQSSKGERYILKMEAAVFSEPSVTCPFDTL